jgi:hypothetical protein
VKTPYLIPHLVLKQQLLGGACILAVVVLVEVPAVVAVLVMVPVMLPV